MRPDSDEALNVARPARPARPLIIERPDLQTRVQRYGYLSVTLLCWLAWLYLFVPLLSFVAWALGATLIYQVMLQNLESAELLALLARYGSGAGVLSAVYLTWAVSSWLRFRNVERRKEAPAAGDAALAASHHLPPGELAGLRQGARVVVFPEQLERMFAAPPGHPDRAPGDDADGPPHRQIAAGG